MDCLVDIDCQLFLRFHSWCERLFPFLHFLSSLLRAKFVVYDFECTSFFHGAIGGGAVGTINDFASHTVDNFRERLPMDVFEVRTAETFYVCPTVRFL
jgi:hypothetical protein